MLKYIELGDKLLYEKKDLQKSLSVYLNSLNLLKKLYKSNPIKSDINENSFNLSHANIINMLLKIYYTFILIHVKLNNSNEALKYIDKILKIKDDEHIALTIRGVVL